MAIYYISLACMLTKISPTSRHDKCTKAGISSLGYGGLDSWSSMGGLGTRTRGGTLIVRREESPRGAWSEWAWRCPVEMNPEANSWQAAVFGLRLGDL